jgi:hypothetical protein
MNLEFKMAYNFRAAVLQTVLPSRPVAAAALPAAEADPSLME